jgi:hypothetical protein
VPKAEALSAVPGSTPIFDDGSSSSSSFLSKKKGSSIHCGFVASTAHLSGLGWAYWVRSCGLKSI